MVKRVASGMYGETCLSDGLFELALHGDFEGGAGQGQSSRVMAIRCFTEKGPQLRGIPAGAGAVCLLSTSKYIAHILLK